MSQDNGTLKFECKVHFGSSRRGRKQLVMGEAPQEVVPEGGGVGGGRVPKVARLLALAIRLQGLLERGEVTNYAQLAAVGHVTRARVTQIMNLTLLAPDLQEQVLFLPRTLRGRDPLTEHDLRPIAAEFEWAKQRRMWKPLLRRLPNVDSNG